MSSEERTVSVALGAIFSTYEISRIHVIERFLVHVADREIAAAAAKLGYTAEEHEEGWKAWATAAGMFVPFTQHLSEAEVALTKTHDGTLVALVHDIDQFENRWFPRARTAIRRFIAADKRDAYEQAFFQDMQQQPEGPGVIPSVDRFVARFEGMGKSDVKGAAEAYRSLVRRGLSKAAVKQMKEMIAEAKRLQEPLEGPKVDADSVAASADERRAAYDHVNRWFNDWAETFRSELSHRQLVRLGLVLVKGGRKGSGDDGDDPSTPVNA